MDTDRDTVLTAVSTTVDTILQAEIVPHTPVRPGPTPIMSDSEVRTLELIGQWRGSSERDLLRWADAELRPWFPVLLSQSAFNRRCRELAPCCAELMIRLAAQLGADQTPYQILDTTPVPLVRRAHHGWRQMIETVNEKLADVMHLAFPRARTIWGVVTRVVAKCTAVNVGIGINRWCGRPALALETLFSG